MNLVGTDSWADLISGYQIDDLYAEFTLQPYQSAWTTNKFEPTGEEHLHSCFYVSQ
ncbi:MAG: hypothetical protein WBG70_12945 [Spirulinaceae cyanobacterium]